MLIPFGNICMILILWTLQIAFDYKYLMYRHIQQALFECRSNGWAAFPKDQYLCKKSIMEFSREDKLEAIADLNRVFAEHLEIADIPPDESREEILKRIQRADDEYFSILASFNNAWLAWDYIRTDKELKIKVEDVWKMEMDRHKAIFEEAKTEVLKLASTNKVDLEPLMLRINWL